MCVALPLNNENIYNTTVGGTERPIVGKEWFPYKEQLTRLRVSIWKTEA